MLWHIPLNRWDVLFAATTNVGPPVELSPCSARGLGCTPCSFSPSFSSRCASARLERAQKASFGDLPCCCPARLAVLLSLEKQWVLFEALLVGWCPAPDLEKHPWVQKPFCCRGPAPIAGRRSPGLILLLSKLSGENRAIYLPESTRDVLR